MAAPASILPRKVKLLIGFGILVLIVGLGAIALSNPTSPLVPVTLPGPANMARLSVDRAGMVAIKASTLISSDLGWNNLDLAHLRLIYRGHDEPLQLEGQGAAATLMFYAQAVDSRYTADNVYFLQPIDRPSQIMPDSISTASSTTALEFYTATLRVEENHLYSPQVQDGDHWFWMQLPAPQAKALTLTLDALGSGPGHLQLEVWGSTEATRKLDHHLRVSINGQTVADETFSGIARHLIEADIPAGVLIEGDNIVTVQAPGDTGVIADIVFLDWIEVRYPRRFVAQNDRLEFSGPIGPAQLIGFSGLIELYDISNPDRVTHIDQASAGFIGAADHRYLAIGPNGYVTAHIARAATKPDLRAIGLGAQYVAIGPADLLAAAQPVLEWHSSQGLKSIAVSADAIYDQFNHGLPEPEAIQAFLKYAAANWNPAPKYVLLVGDASYDPLGYSAPPDGNRLPTYFIQTIYGGETASDVAFAQLHTDSPLPDLAIGRVPARTIDQVQVWVDKTLSYARGAPGGDWRRHILAVADGQEAAFSRDAQVFLNLFPKNYQTTLINPPPNVAGSNQSIVAKFEAGNIFVAYFGHGSVTQWGKDSLFTVKDAAAVNNGNRLPVVLNMTCLTGLFTHPKVESLAEALLWRSGGGAMAVLAPTSLTLAADQSFLSNAFVDAYVADPTSSLGQILLEAWRKIPTGNSGAQDVLRTFMLFGDPALRLVQP